MALQEWLFAHFSAATILATLLALPLVAITWAGYTVRALGEASAQATGRRVDWRRGLLLLPAALVPYLDARIGIMLLPAMLLYAASIFERLGVMQALGPTRYFEVLQSASAEMPQRQLTLYGWIASIAVVLTGAVLWLFSPGPAEWSFWFALGLMLHGIASGIERIRRLRRFRPAQIRMGPVPMG